MFGSRTTLTLEGTACKGCGEKELIWWSEDETEDTLEVYVECSECDHYYGKRFVSKENDTSDSALEDIARKIAK